MNQGDPTCVGSVQCFLRPVHCTALEQVTWTQSLQWGNTVIVLASSQVCVWNCYLWKRACEQVGVKYYLLRILFSKIFCHVFTVTSVFSFSYGVGSDHGNAVILSKWKTLPSFCLFKTGFVHFLTGIIYNYFAAAPVFTDEKHFCHYTFVACTI